MKIRVSSVIYTFLLLSSVVSTAFGDPTSVAIYFTGGLIVLAIYDSKK